ncbi:LOW QUALITY PROTEIN: hypothetical protein TorRG33x02_292520 [Trema orientale]|uniref:Uncharacterized protein n=1 Tax=Trema orientale TaxID=63057 RepID=A0A2P5CA12_TREOI|nr:LOW QUALITY PROTEIN: hypothetical protein TorRG33x02_292520 [Trema orientale]
MTAFHVLYCLSLIIKLEKRKKERERINKDVLIEFGFPLSFFIDLSSPTSIIARDYKLVFIHEIWCSTKTFPMHGAPTSPFWSLLPLKSIKNSAASADFIYLFTKI